MTAGSVLLAAVSVAAAAVGPMYQSGAASSYLVTLLRSETNLSTGLTWDYDPADRNAGTPTQALAQARTVAARRASGHFTEPHAGVVSKRVRTRFPHVSSSDVPLGVLLAKAGACQHLQVSGRCPRRPGEALMLKYDSEFTHTAVGDHIRVSGLRRPVTVVGTYRAPRPDSYWFDVTRYVSTPAQPAARTPIPYHPAPLVTVPQTFTQMPASAWYVRVDRRLAVPASTTAADLEQAVDDVRAVKSQPKHVSGGARFTLELGNSLVALSKQVQTRASTAKATVTPAVVSLLLVALVLLVRLLMAAMDARRPELALASLRGVARRRMWVLGMVEPVLMTAIAAPVGLVSGYLAGRWLGSVWLVPGLPMAMGWASWVSVAGVLAVVLGAAALVVRAALSESLSGQIAGARRPLRSSRRGLVVRLVVVAGACALLVATAAAGAKSRPDATDLLLPIALAVAVGLLMAAFVAFAGRQWARWSRFRRGMAGYVASRTISRRREGTLVVLPLTAALAVAVFAAGVYWSAASWRASDAATQVGADEAYHTTLDIGRAVALTHRLDPDGRWLMAAAVVHALHHPPKVLVDSPRLARVSAWQDSWLPGKSASAVANALSVQRPSLDMTGTHLSMTVQNKVSMNAPGLTIAVNVETARGDSSTIFIG
ncbi:MAG: FtsX-like permease family protein, partial [Nocardioidaceae bacterium]